MYGLAAVPKYRKKYPSVWPLLAHAIGEFLTPAFVSEKLP